MEALVIDVKNYEAFKELVEGKMLEPDEGEFERWRCWAGLLGCWVVGLSGNLSGGVLLCCIRLRGRVGWVGRRREVRRGAVMGCE